MDLNITKDFRESLTGVEHSEAAIRRGPKLRAYYNNMPQEILDFKGKKNGRRNEVDTSLPPLLAIASDSDYDQTPTRNADTISSPKERTLTS